MDFGRSRDERDSRINRERPRYSRDDSPPPRPPVQSSSSYQSIPLRSAYPQRFPEFQSSNSSHWRPDNPTQLPSRPIQRYRSPTAPVATSTSTRTWEARPRDSSSAPARRWTRDDFSTSIPRPRLSTYRDTGLSRSDRENGERRPYPTESNNSRHFDIPFRSRGSIKKRTRDSSEDGDDFSVHSRSRGGSAERRARIPMSNGARGLERRIGDYSTGATYAHLCVDIETMTDLATGRQVVSMFVQDGLPRLHSLIDLRTISVFRLGQATIDPILIARIRRERFLKVRVDRPVQLLAQRHDHYRLEGGLCRDHAQRHRLAHVNILERLRLEVKLNLPVRPNVGSLMNSSICHKQRRRCNVHHHQLCAHSQYVAHIAM